MFRSLMHGVSTVWGAIMDGVAYSMVAQVTGTAYIQLTQQLNNNNSNNEVTISDNKLVVVCLDVTLTLYENYKNKFIPSLKTTLIS